MDFTFANLPPHVVTQILSHLNLADFKNAILVCTTWYSASCCIECGRNIQIRVTDDQMDRLELIGRPFHKLILHQVNLDAECDFDRIFLKLKFCLHELSMYGCSMSCTQFFQMLNILSNLEVLKISMKQPHIEWLNNCCELNYLDRMKKIRVLCFYAQIIGVNRILAKCRNLDDLTYRTIDCYLNSEQRALYEFDHIIAGIAQWNCINMTYLNIFNYKINANSFMQQFRTLKIVRLDKLDLRSFARRYDALEFNKFCKHLNVLKDLEMFNVGNSTLTSICENLKSLTRLAIHFHGDQLYRIGGLSNLEILKLKIKHGENENLVQQLFSISLPKITVLWLEDVHISKGSLILLCNNFKNLIDLKLELHTTDCRPIFKLLPQLKRLTLAIVGDETSETETFDEEFTILNLEKLKQFKINRYVPGITAELLRLHPNVEIL